MFIEGCCSTRRAIICATVFAGASIIIIAIVTIAITIMVMIVIMIVIVVIRGSSTVVEVEW